MRRRSVDGVEETLSTHALEHGVLHISRGSVVHFEGDAIVNAANRGCLGGGGVDGAISSAGGDALADARLALPLVRRGVRCEAGDAVVTVGGELRAKWCVHAVGPNYYEVADEISVGSEDVDLEAEAEAMLRADALLFQAYTAAMGRAQHVGAQTVGFSLLSSGIFRGRQSLANVLKIAVNALKQASYPGLERVHLVAFTASEQSSLLAAAEHAFAPPLDLASTLEDPNDDGAPEQPDHAPSAPDDGEAQEQPDHAPSAPDDDAQEHQPDDSEIPLQPEAERASPEPPTQN